MAPGAEDLDLHRSERDGATRWRDVEDDAIVYVEQLLLRGERWEFAFRAKSGNVARVAVLTDRRIVSWTPGAGTARTIPLGNVGEITLVGLNDAPPGWRGPANYEPAPEDMEDGWISREWLRTREGRVITGNGLRLEAAGGRLNLTFRSRYKATLFGYRLVELIAPPVA